MMKTAIGITVLILVALAVPVFAQGPFADVPTDHWAYDAVNELQQAGIVIGYPDSTFGGKRAMTRYEFAVAIARAIPVIAQRVQGAGTPGPQGPKGEKGDVGPAGPAGSGGVTPEQFQTLQNLVNEFRDELASLGVQVDSLQRDLAALAARVKTIEDQMNKFRPTVKADVAFLGTNTSSGTPFDLDNRPLQGIGTATGDVINSITAIHDFDLIINSNLSKSLTGVVDIDFGNYLFNYLGGTVNDYVGTLRPASTPGDAFFPYYTYLEAGLGGGSLSVGRLPMQLTPYTLKMVDVDSYTFNDKTDSGDYPLDGGKFIYRFKGVNLMGMAAKTNQNSIIPGGLISQPTIAMYNPVFGALHTPFNVPGGHAAGGLVTTDQMAAARATIGTPFKGNLGLTYMQAVGPTTAAGYNRVDVYGADINAQVSKFPISAEYAQTRTKGTGVATVTGDNHALDGKVGWNPGKLGIDVGYREVERNFTAPGYWTKLGMWTNPSNIKGPYANFTYGLRPALNLVANGAYYKGKKNFVGTLPTSIDQTGDKVWKAEGGLKWGFTNTNSVNLGIEYVRWEPSGATKTKEQYINIGLAHQFNPNAGVSLGYQIIDYKPGTDAPYGPASYKGGVAVAQFKAQF